MKFIVTAVLMLGSMMAATPGFAKTSVLIIQGLAGEDYYQRHFDEQVEKISEASAKLTDQANIRSLAGDEATKSTILSALTELLQASSANDLLLVYLIGHGSHDGRDYKFNLTGPDITGVELLESLSAYESTIVLINTSSSSGALLKSFETSKVNLITATKSGAERTATRFGRHFADALAAGEADVNKNVSISLQEAYDYALRETNGFYDTEGLLATENPRLQMSGNTNAGQIKLANLQQQTTNSSNPALTALYESRDELDRQIDTLRLRRINLSDEEYLQQFQGLMIELSLLQAQIDAEAESQ